MHDEKVSRSGVIAGSLWAASGATLLAAGGESIAGAPWSLCAWMGFAAVILSAGAATATVRTYFVRLSVIVRSLHGIESEHHEGLRSVKRH